MKKPKIYNITPAKGQALLNFQGRLMPSSDLKMTLYEAELAEEVKGSEKRPGGADKQAELNSDFKNLLIHGDCLSACAYLKSQNIKADLVYIDPPFASGANYAKKIYLRNGGETKFENDDASIGEEIMYGDIWQKEDYLNWLYERLLAIREVMSENAVIYLHLDWHIGHYAKILMDEVFGEENFKNEIVWHYEDKFATGGNSFDKNHDNILIYALSDKAVFCPVVIPKEQTTKRALRKKVDGKTINVLDENGSKIYAEYSEKKADDVWDIGRTISKNEYEDYATQKPRLLLERIINASSDKGMVVADFFSGSGTTAKVANDLGRKFLACDVGVNAIQTSRDVLRKSGAEFNILKIKDGLRLFRNPAQTTARLFSLIDSFKSREELELGEFWDGGIAGAKGSFIPVKFIGIDKVLTKPLLDSILEEVYRLEETSDAGSVKLIYSFKDLDIDQAYISKEAGKKSEVKVELVSLDDLLDEKRDMIFTPDNALLNAKRDKGKTRLTIEKYFSPYLRAKIDEYNAKRVHKDAEAKEMKISDSGLELIEAVQIDTTLKGKVWHADIEDKAGRKEKVKGVYEVPAERFRIKIRNIAGDEIVIDDFAK